MTSLRLNTFGGMIPAVDSRLLPDHAAAYAKGTYPIDGTARGFRPSVNVFTLLNSSNQRVFRLPNDVTQPGTVTDFSSSVWMEFANRETDVLRSPVIGDLYQRFYWAGNGIGPTYNTGARIRAGQQAYTLGVPAPTTGAPTVTASGGSSTTGLSRAYLYTYVSTFGEEGPPSPPAVVNGKLDDAWTVVIPAVPGAVQTNRSLASIRLYRTVTSSSGVATYFLVQEFASLAQQNFNDTITDNVVTLNNQLQSINWAPPPTLKGLVQMPNGIMAGWANESDVYFCEPYRPHAWPAQYSVTVDSPIVGLGVTGNSLVVATKGCPTIMTGINPRAMSQVTPQVMEPCTSRQSIVSTPQGVYYASPNGIVVAGSSGVDVVTRPLLSKEQWLTLLDPYSLRAVRHGTGYMGVTGNVGSTAAFFIDAGNVGFNWLDLGANVTNLQSDFWTGETFAIVGGAVQHVNSPVTSTGMNPYLWRSKVYTLPYPQNLAAAKLLFTVPTGTVALNPTPNTNLNQTLAADQWGLFRVYADGNLVFCREIRGSGEEFHNLPSGFKATLWQFEVEARIVINTIEVASTMRELRNV